MLTYAAHFAADARPVWAAGLNINPDRRTINSYRIVQVKRDIIIAGTSCE